MIGMFLIPALIFAAIAVGAISAGVASITFFGGGIIICLIVGFLLGIEANGKGITDIAFFSLLCYYGAFIYFICWIVCLFIYFIKTSGG